MQLTSCPFKFWEFDFVVIKINFYIVISEISRIAAFVGFFCFKFRETSFFFKEFLKSIIYPENTI